MMLGSPPGVPGGGITGITPPPVGGAAMPGSIPAGGQITPFERDSASLRLALPVVSPGATAPWHRAGIPLPVEMASVFAIARQHMGCRLPVRQRSRPEEIRIA
jgi:hypothetical protein